MAHIAAFFLVFLVASIGPPCEAGFSWASGTSPSCRCCSCCGGGCRRSRRRPGWPGGAPYGPVFFLALAFFVLEIITLLVLRDHRGHAVPAVKDALFVVLYAIFLIVAGPAVE